MRILTDQDVYKVTVDKLREWGCDVVTVKEIGLERASDEEILIKAKEMGRVLVTRDKDFGALVFLRKELSTGVILLRITPVTVEDVHMNLRHLLQEHAEEELKHLFCVVEPYRYRIRHLKQHED